MGGRGEEKRERYKNARYLPDTEQKACPEIIGTSASLFRASVQILKTEHDRHLVGCELPVAKCAISG
jgi:hypothetical protein